MKTIAIIIMVGSLAVVRYFSLNIDTYLFGFVIGTIVALLVFIDVMRDNNKHMA